MLINGIMKCGLGNWEDVSEQFVKNKNPQECEEHYFAFYYKSRSENQLTIKDFIVFRNLSGDLTLNEYANLVNTTKLLEY